MEKTKLDLIGREKEKFVFSPEARIIPNCGIILENLIRESKSIINRNKRNLLLKWTIYKNKKKEWSDRESEETTIVYIDEMEFSKITRKIIWVFTEIYCRTKISTFVRTIKYYWCLKKNITIVFFAINK